MEKMKFKQKIKLIQENKELIEKKGTYVSKLGKDTCI